MMLGALLIALLSLRHSGASWSASNVRTVEEPPVNPGGYWTRDANPRDGSARGPQRPTGKNKTDSEDFYRIESIASGEDHTCVLLSGDGGLRCWGSGFYGQLLSGSSDNIGDDIDERNAIPRVDLGTDKQAVEVACGAAHTCVILTDGNVKCWGWGVCGQTGYGHSLTLGDEMSETGDNLRTIDLGGKRALSLALGETHTCAILDDQSVRCWGCNNERQLGVASPVLDETQGFPMPSALSAVPGVDRPVELAAGATYTCVRMEPGQVVCVGSFGEPSDPTGVWATPSQVLLPKPAVKLISGRFFACAVLEDATLHCFGQTFSKEFPGGRSVTRTKRANVLAITAYAVPLQGRVREAAAGDFHVCAATGNVTHRCWGWNAYDQLGFKSNAKAFSADTDQLTRMLPGLRVAKFALGSAHTCAVVGQKRLTVRCVGIGLAGQRGDGLRTESDVRPGMSVRASSIRFSKTEELTTITPTPTTPKWTPGSFNQSSHGYRTNQTHGATTTTFSTSHLHYSSTSANSSHTKCTEKEEEDQSLSSSIAGSDGVQLVGATTLTV